MNASYLKTICEVINGKRHQDYERTWKYAERVTNLAIGEDGALADILKQVIRRETTEDFKQRIDATKLLVKALMSKLFTPFTKSTLRDNANISLSDEEKLVYESFMGSTGLDAWMNEYYEPYSKVDPNAHLLISIRPFNHNIEKASVSPEIISSKDSLYFEYDMDRLMLYVCKYGSGYKLFHRGERINGQLTKACNGILATPIKEEVAHTEWREDIAYENIVDENTTSINIKIGNQIYRFDEFEPKIEGIQVMRIGYKRDLQTNLRTMISPIDAALPRIEKTIVATSEFDLSLLLHVFPQKIVRVPVCKGGNNEKGIFIRCDNGMQLGEENKVCTNCKGTGDEPLHQSAMDVITVKEESRKEDERSLSEMVHYNKPDIETPKFLNDFIQQAFELCWSDIFPQNPTSTTAPAAETATKVALDESNLNIVIIPYVHRNEIVWTFCMHTTMEIRGERNITASKRFPDDLTIKSIDELIANYKDSFSAPYEVRKRLREKINRKLAVGNNMAEKKMAIRIIHEPFADKTEAQINGYIGKGLVLKEDQILIAYYDKIMTKLENQYKEYWIDLTPDFRDVAIAEEVKKIIDKLPQQQPLVFNA